MNVANGSMHSTQRRGVVVEVDEGASAPDLDPARDQGEVLGPAVGLVEQIGLVQERVRPIEAIAPAVEGAGEAAPGALPRSFDELTPRWRQALWKARTVVASIRTTMIDLSRISYSTKSPGFGISARRHAICQTRGQSSSHSMA